MYQPANIIELKLLKLVRQHNDAMIATEHFMRSVYNTKKQKDHMRKHILDLANSMASS